MLDIAGILLSRATEVEYACAMQACLPRIDEELGVHDALARTVPPSYDEYRHFFNRVLTPGIPGSLPPVESLFEDWGGHRAGLQHGQGFYLGRSAQHVQEVCDSLEIEVPEAYKAVPDHLLLLLELNEFLCDHAPADQAHLFAEEHFGWLSDYLDALGARMENEDDEALASAASFYCNFVDLVRRVVLDEWGENDVREVAQSA
ncbi:MAG: molecular chaperone TorD family protein [Eggerthellaceae bacterium]|nr:molecular chaperone TorD family protein [Eggerthellaceae bacterium]